MKTKIANLDKSLDQIGSAKETFKDSQLEHPQGVLVSEYADP